MKLPAHLHNKLVEAGQHSIACRAGNGRTSKKHMTAIAELDEVIGQIMDAMPQLYTDKAWRELDERRRKAND